MTASASPGRHLGPPPPRADGRRSLEDLVSSFEGRAVCLAFSKDPNAKLTVLLFRTGEARPERVAKVPSTPGAARSVASEVAMLRRLHEMTLGAVGATIPSVVDVVTHDGLPVMVTRGLPGASMLTRYHAWRHTARPEAVAEDLAMASEWLALFQQRTARGTADLGEMLDGVPDGLRRRFDGDPHIDGDLVTLAGLHGRLQGWRVASTAVHGDFWLGNLLVAGGRVSGVVDWEQGRSLGLPVHDLARFAISYSLYLDRHTRPGGRVAGHPGLRAGRWGAGIDHAVDGHGWYPAAARRFVGDGLRRLGLPPAMARDVLLAELAVLAARSDHPRFARDHLRVFRRLAARPGTTVVRPQ